MMTSSPELVPPLLPATFWRHLLAIAVLSLALSVAYAKTFGSDWTSEARNEIRDSPRFAAAHLRNLIALVEPSPGNTSREWEQSLPRFSYWMDRVAWGVDNAQAYHATNIILHWINTLLLYVVAMAVMRNAWAAFFIAGLFAIHPVATDAVSNIAGRPELLAAAAVLASLCCFTRLLVTRRRRQFRWLVLLCICQAAGVASHEIAWALPAVLAAYYFSFCSAKVHRSEFRRSLVAVSLPLIGMAVLFAKHLLKPAAVLPEMALAANPLLTLDGFNARLTALKVLGNYLLLPIWPQTLLPDYSFNQIALVRPASYAFEGWKVVLVLIILIFLFAGTVQAYRKNRRLFFFLVCFFLALLPASNLFRIGPAIMAERYLYLPLMGFAGCVVCAVYALARLIIPRVTNIDWGRRELPAFTARMTLFAILLCFAGRTFARNFEWQNDRALWSAAVRDEPDNYQAHLRLALAFNLNERRELAPMVREAKEALRIVQQPSWPEAHPPRDLFLQLGRAYRRQAENIAPGPATEKNSGWYRQSIDVLELAAAADRAEKERWRGRRGMAPMAPIYLNLGVCHARLGERTAALSSFQTLEQQAPGNPDIYLEIAVACFALDEPERGALACAQAAVLRAWKEPYVLLARSFDDHSGEHCDVAPPDSDELQIPVSCGALQEILKSAYLRLIENYLRSGDRESALRLRSKAITEDSIASTLFDQLLPEKP